MSLLKNINASLLKCKDRLLENNFDGLLWLVNIVPSLAGFSLRKKKTSATFWIIHFFLLGYVYLLGNIVYQVKYARTAENFIKSYVNVALLIQIASNSYWFMANRSALLETLEIINECDQLARRSTTLRKKYEKSLLIIKCILCLFYGWNYMNEFGVYLWRRTNVNNDYSMTPCVGLEPLTVSPNHEICRIILGAQELSIVAVSLNYQALLLFLVAHTATMYQMMAAEILFFNIKHDSYYVKHKLPIIIRRHVLTLDVADRLQSLYSMPIGVNFGTNAICMCAFFFMPLQAWISLIPIVGYCFLVFFLYCFLCQSLTNAAEEFERAVYSCGWENFDLVQKKVIYIMLRQAQKPVQIMGADIIPVNVYTFATLIQLMYKFVTVVKF